MVGFKSTILVFVFYLSHVFVMGHSLSNFMSSLWLIELILIFSFKFLYCYLPIPFFVVTLGLQNTSLIYCSLLMLLYHFT